MDYLLRSVVRIKGSQLGMAKHLGASNGRELFKSRAIIGRF